MLIANELKINLWDFPQFLASPPTIVEHVDANQDTQDSRTNC